jgi:hypothetical protein
MNHKTLNKIGHQFAARCWKVGGFRLDIQCCRHLAATIILDARPGAMGLVTELLGHKREETTRRFYGRVKRRKAQGSWKEILRESAEEHRTLKPRRRKASR